MAFRIAWLRFVKFIELDFIGLIEFRAGLFDF